MNEEVLDNDSGLAWEVNSANLKINEAKVSMIAVSKLSPHPDNRPLGASEEKIKQLKNFITNDGFDSSHPLVVRPYLNGYQIIEGEHRFKAAKSLGYLQLPCVIRELTDTEALIQLVLGNVQTETKPLEIGINALKVVQKEGNKTYSLQNYAKRLGISETTIRRYMNASEVFIYVKNQLPEGAPVLEEVIKLEEISRCPQADWLWLHDTTVKNELSKNQVVEISQSIREIKTDNAAVYSLFDFMKIRQEIADASLKGNKSLGEIYQDLIRTIESSYENLDERIELFEYNVMHDAIQSESLNLKEWFINNLKELKNLNKTAVLEAYKDALQMKRGSSKDEAERTAAYFRDKKNAKEREEQERIERAMREVKEGDWWQLGEHFLYCGDGSSSEFAKRIPNKSTLAYTNPPFLTQALGANNQMGWALDWLIQKAEIVAVSPEIDQIQNLLKISRMPYRWSFSTHLSMKKSESGLGAWIYTAIFSQRTLDTKIKDAWRVDSTDLQGNKTQEFLKHLLEAFTREHEIVIDTHAGLGAMLLLAESMHRVCYTAEINPAMCKEIIEKWENQSKGKAKKIA
jgi:ParB/RepB/Spo0J family partition protein